jgi:hypothetical protein
MGIQVVGTGLCKCSFGLAPAPLNVLPQNRVLSCGRPVATIMDNKPFVNVVPFGMCTSPSNPAVIAASGAPMPCTPQTPAPWIPGSPTTIIGTGGPALTNSSTLMCVYAGVISVVFPGIVNEMVSP